MSTPFFHHIGFVSLEQADFLRLEHVAYLKGLLRPFKSKGSLEHWASQCNTLRDGLIQLSTQRVLAQAHSYPFNLLHIQLAQQTTGAGTSFLRWRNLDRSRMGVELWETLMSTTSPRIPPKVLDDLYALELQRIVINMQISLTHTLARQASDCARKMARADIIYQQSVNRRQESL